MGLSRRALLPGVALVSLLTIAPTPLGHAAHAATSTPAAACNFALPSSHNLRVDSGGSGVGPVIHLSSGVYSFVLQRFVDINASVRRDFDVTPPAGDRLATFAFHVPGGHYYLGLANTVQQGTQLYRVCWHGSAYRDLTNAFDADRTPPVAVVLDGTIGTSVARVDRLVGATHDDVYGRPRII